MHELLCFVRKVVACPPARRDSIGIQERLSSRMLGVKKNVGVESRHHLGDGVASGVVGDWDPQLYFPGCRSDRGHFCSGVIRHDEFPWNNESSQSRSQLQQRPHGAVPWLMFEPWLWLSGGGKVGELSINLVVKSHQDAVEFVDLVEVIDAREDADWLQHLRCQKRWCEGSKNKYPLYVSYTQP